MSAASAESGRDRSTTDSSEEHIVRDFAAAAAVAAVYATAVVLLVRVSPPYGPTADFEVNPWLLGIMAAATISTVDLIPRLLSGWFRRFSRLRGILAVAVAACVIGVNIFLTSTNPEAFGFGASAGGGQVSPTPIRGVIFAIILGWAVYRAASRPPRNRGQRYGALVLASLFLALAVVASAVYLTSDAGEATAESAEAIAPGSAEVLAPGSAACDQRASTIETALERSFESGYLSGEHLIQFGFLSEGDLDHHVVSLLGESSTAESFAVVGIRGCAKPADPVTCEVELRTLRAAVEAANTSNRDTGANEHWWDYAGYPPAFWKVTPDGQFLPIGESAQC